jgi:ABC-type transporter Mla maintaining outer membrane lipid asymmetry permease subunit MlaE
MAPPSTPTLTPDSDPAEEVQEMVWGALSPLERIGVSMRVFLSYVGELTRLTQRFFKSVTKPPFGWTDLLVQCEAIGVRSTPIAALILFFVGLVFAFQFGETLRTMGAVPYVGRVTSLSIVREGRGWVRASPPNWGP